MKKSLKKEVRKHLFFFYLLLFFLFCSYFKWENVEKNIVQDGLLLTFTSNDMVSPTNIYVKGNPKWVKHFLAINICFIRQYDATMSI